MTTIRYHLSSRQAKELDRGRRLRIALPMPDDWADEDPLAFARAVLLVRPEWIRAAEVIELPVVAPLSEYGSTGLTARLGQIAHAADRQRDNLLIYRVVCVVCDVHTAEQARFDGRTQWPAAVEIDGQRYPDAP